MSDFKDFCPDFNDPKHQPEILKQLADYARMHGYTDEEMKDMRDRRHLAMVCKAMMYDMHKYMHNKDKE